MSKKSWTNEHFRKRKKEIKAKRVKTNLEKSVLKDSWIDCHKTVFGRQRKGQ